MKQPLFDQVLQVGIVVQDAKATACRYSDLLGLDDWRFNEVDTEKGRGRDFQSAQQPIHARALIAWMPLGNVELELIEPRDQVSVYAEFLRDRGPGVHHIMFATPDYDRCAERLSLQGVSALGSGALQSTRFTLFDTQAELGLICEIAEGEALEPDDTTESPWQ